MFKTSKAPLLWSLALGGALLTGCKEETPAGGGAGAGPATRPTTGPAMPMPRPPTTQPGEGAMIPGTPGSPDVTATPGTPAIPRLPGIPGAGDAEPAGGRVGPATRPTTLPGGVPLVLPKTPGAPGTPPETDNK